MADAPRWRRDRPTLPARALFAVRPALLMPLPAWPPLDTRRGPLDFARPYVLGVLNVTPDSFSDGGRYAEVESAVRRGVELESQGADVLDVGGESTRPGARPVDVDEEIRRVQPVIARLAEKLSIPISIDTRRPPVAEAALRAGASIVNDVSGANDPEQAVVAARYRAPIILGHLRGTPSTMQGDICFRDVSGEVIEELRLSIDRAVAQGVPREQIVVDPGLGFGKTAAQTAELLGATSAIRQKLRRPICIGASRKSFIGALTGAALEDRLLGTAAATAIAVQLGADFVRVHEVAEMKPIVALAAAARAKRL